MRRVLRDNALSLTMFGLFVVLLVAGKASSSRTLHEHSLSIALLALFLFSLVLHALGGHAEDNTQQLEHGQAGTG